jgi:hypothetical protein
VEAAAVLVLVLPRVQPLATPVVQAAAAAVEVNFLVVPELLDKAILAGKVLLGMLEDHREVAAEVAQGLLALLQLQVRMVQVMEGLVLPLLYLEQ